jgi:hypothetical protein
LTNTAISTSVGKPEPEWVVWLTVGIALTIGFWLQLSVSRQMQSITLGDSTLSYPSNWVQTSKHQTGFTVADLNEGGPFGPRVSLYQFGKKILMPGKGELYQAAINWSLMDRQNKTSYSMLEIKNVKIKGRDAIQLESAYLLSIGANRMPGLMHSVDTILLNGNQFNILSFAAEQSRFEELSPLRKQILAHWQLRNPTK